MQKVLGLTYASENAVLEHATRSYIGRFHGHGIHAEILNLATPDAGAQIKAQLESGTVSFGFALQGVGSRLTIGPSETNLWTQYQTPFLSLHHDNPSCNVYNHCVDSRYVANLYLFESFLDVQTRYLRSHQINAWLPYEIDYMPCHQGLPFAERPLDLLFLKTGKEPRLYVDQLNQIVEPLREAVWAALDQAGQNENLVLFDLLAEAFRTCGYDPQNHQADFWGFADLMENYLRAQRAAQFVESLKHQKGALIMGDGWDFIDKTSAKAIFKPATAAHSAIELFPQTKIVCNTSPYGRDIIHERVTLGLCNHALVVSDTNAWWDKHFSDVPSLTRFRWKDDLSAVLNTVRQDPELADKAASPCGEKRVRDTLFRDTHIDRMLDIAAQVRAFAAQENQISPSRLCR